MGSEITTKFKVGDRVKFTRSHTSNPEMWDKISTIIEIRNDGRQFPYIIKLGMTGRFPALACEIEHIKKIGEQLLLFEFMEKR